MILSTLNTQIKPQDGTGYTAEVTSCEYKNICQVIFVSEMY